MLKNISFLIIWLLLGTYSGAQTIKLSLNEAVEFAKTNNKQLQSQQLEEQLAAEKTNEIRSNLLPNISASAGYQYYFDRQVIFMPGSFVENSSKSVADIAVGGKYALNTSLSISQQLSNKSTRQQIEMAKVQESAQRLQTQDLMSQLSVNVSVNYLNMLLLQEQIALNEQSLDRNRRALDDSRALFLQGKNLKVDTLRNYIAIENLKSGISYLRNDLEVLALQMKRWLALPQEVVIELTDSISEQMLPPLPLDLNSVVEIALQNRKDIKQYQLSILMNKHQIMHAQAQKLPQLWAVGMYQMQSQADDLNIGDYSFPRTSFIGLQATLPIYAGDRLNARINQTKIRLQQSEITLSDLHEKVRSELAASLSKLKEAEAQLGIQQQQVEMAELSYTMMNDRYRNGLSSRIELADAELALTQAKLNLLQAIHRFRLLQIDLQQNIGIL